MISIVRTVCMLSIGLALAGCDRSDIALEKPAAAELKGEEIGYFCNMTVAAHKGPKGQIFLRGKEQPLWFSSARDTIAFTLLPEEPRHITAVYVSDMAVASWNSPEPGTWTDAVEAWYVIDSERVGGMGAPEPVPFSRKEEAKVFQGQHGGRVVKLQDIPEENILGSSESTLTSPSIQDHSKSGHSNGGHSITQSNNHASSMDHTKMSE